MKTQRAETHGDARIAPVKFVCFVVGALLVVIAMRRVQEPDLYWEHDPYAPMVLGVVYLATGTALAFRHRAAFALAILGAAIVAICSAIAGFSIVSLIQFGLAAILAAKIRNVTLNL